MRRILKACGNTAAVAVVLASLVKGPGHTPIGWLLNDALMFASGTWAMMTYLTWREKKTDRTP